MNNYFRFFISNSKILTFLILFTFFSGFGQTFLLSIYIPSFLNDFEISRTFYSLIYSLATILSGFSLIFIGKIIDRVPVKMFALAVVAGLVIANLAAAFSFNAAFLFFAIFLLRFFGQGLATHTSFTIAGKQFQKNRGKALSIAYLGFPLTEGIMPVVIISCVTAFGWRETFMLSALIILICLLPLTLLLLNKSRIKSLPDEFSQDIPQVVATERMIKPEKQIEILRGRRFFLIAPTPFLVGFIITAVFFFQTFIADYKSWSIEWMAINISVYAVSSFVFSVIAGPLTDKFSAKNIFPFVMLPLLLGFAVLFSSNHPYAATAYWFFIGVSAGINSTVTNAMYAETYGTENLGSVRSLFTFVMIIGTALGPLVYSLLLDAGFNFSQINFVLSLIVIIYSIIIYKTRRLT